MNPPSPKPLPQDALSQVLDILRLKGSSVSTLVLPHPHRTDHAPGLPCLYAVREGAMVFEHGDGVSVTAGQGEVVLLARGTAHTVACGHGHARATALQGYFDFDGGFAARFLGPLPALIRLPSPPSGAYDWVEIGCALIAEESEQELAGAAAMVSRILDLLFVRTLRTWAAQNHAQTGWLAGAMDPRIGRAIAAMHAQPQRNWSLEELAALGPMSRTAFAERFANVVGETPMAYLNGWRLDCAARLLLGASTVGSAALGVGYTSVSAFSRAFKARHGCSPVEYGRDAVLENARPGRLAAQKSAPNAELP